MRPIDIYFVEGDRAFAIAGAVDLRTGNSRLRVTSATVRARNVVVVRGKGADVPRWPAAAQGSGPGIAHDEELGARRCTLSVGNRTSIG